MVLGVLVVVSVILLSASVQADVFKMPDGQTSLQFVPVGDPGNPADTTVMWPDNTTGYGSVPYTYQMGKYDVTVGQYCQFLNAVAATDPYGVYNPYMGFVSGAHSFAPLIVQNGSSGSYTYSVSPGTEEFPVNHVSWGDAARFCNWLQNGQPTSGVENASTTENGAYTLNGDTTNLMTESRNVGATYFIPSENEWYKAAYYKGGGNNAGYWLYPTKSDTPPSNLLSASGTNNANYYDSATGYTDPTNYLTPVGYFQGSPGPYGTYDMGGDVMQWNEAVVENWQGNGPLGRGLRGGAFDTSGAAWLASDNRSYDGPSNAGDKIDVGLVGFRVACVPTGWEPVPEPSTLALLAVGAISLLAYTWRRRAG
jgi:formylglycine-generating enzyme required for sulfatase activity